ncbi:MAG: ATP-binding cassette domain-containing protein [bacterium]|nr:ATP-binding cassette domain-containing protein [bacterium]
MESPYQNKSGDLARLVNICLDYGQARVLNHIYLELGYSEVHAIVGEHGAGKSSLGLIMSGILKPQRGAVTFEGQWHVALDVATALKLGIRMIYQQIRLYEELTVAENLFLSNKRINRLLWNRKRHFREAAQDILARYDFDIDPVTPVRNLNLSDQTVIEILKNLSPQPKLLILDEVLERLSVPALHKILNIFMELKRIGTSILFITHKIDDIYAFADRVSIIKKGEILVTDGVRNIDKLNLIKMAYTQITTEQNIEDPNKEFNQYLKYNEAILRNLPINLLVVDNHQRIKMVNEHCKQHFALQAPSYLNVPLEQFFSEANINTFEFLNNAFLSEEGETFYQVPIIVNDIPTINTIRTFPIYDGSFLIGHIFIIEDVTEYDQLQKQFMLSEKLASVGLLAAGVAHEINNPLGIIANYLSYIKYHFDDRALHEAIDNVHEEITSISHIVSNLHAFSDNKQSIGEEIDINELIQNTLNLIKYNAKYKHIKIQFEPYENDIQITANKNEIKQVILNLFKNSFEAMPSGGNIYIKTTLITEDGSGLVQIQFHDTGPGIRDENPDNIFLPFYSTKKGQESNLGLGLSVSYGILKKYHGTIAVENIESGCKFIINLPQNFP